MHFGNTINDKYIYYLKVIKHHTLFEIYIKAARFEFANPDHKPSVFTS